MYERLRAKTKKLGKKKTYYFTLPAFLLLAISACNTVKTEKELLNYVRNPEHGLFKEKKVGNVLVTAMYKPSDLIVAQEIRGDSVSRQELDSIVGHYRQYLYFILSISENGKEILGTNRGSTNEFGYYVNELAFNMGSNVFLINAAQDTLPLVDYVYPRVYGMAPATNMMFAFKQEKLDGSGYVKLDVKDIGLQTGDMSFKFREKDIKKAPRLKLMNNE